MKQPKVKWGARLKAETVAKIKRAAEVNKTSEGDVVDTAVASADARVNTINLEAFPIHHVSDKQMASLVSQLAKTAANRANAKLPRKAKS